MKNSASYSYTVKKAAILFLFAGIPAIFASEDPIFVREIAGYYEKPVSILKIECDMRIPHPWHINSDSTDQPWLITTGIVLKDSSAGSLVKKDYPKPEIKTLFGEKMAVFEGDLHFKNYFFINPSAMFPISAILQYQSCDNKMCYPPRYRKFIIENVKGKIVISFPHEL